MRKPAKFGDRLSLRCIRCQTERYDIVSWVDGSLLQREYVHPEGYAMAEKHTRSEFRATLIGLYRDEAKRAEQAEHVNVTDGAVARIGNGATGRARARAGRG
jgi:hypothetical protein